MIRTAPTASLALLVLSAASSLEASQPAVERWFIAGYAGEITFTRFNQIVRLRTDFRDSYVAAISGGRIFYYPLPALQFEVEGQMAWHWRRQDHVELNAAAIGRWTRFPWNDRVRTTVALGIGPSIALETPAIERERHERASRRLLFMPFEITAAPPGRSWEALIRVHHRSGGFDWASRASGSNFVTVGGRVRF
jgi:hypothetical protein